MTATLLRRAGYQSGRREGPCAARLARSRRRGEASRERDRRAARRLRVVPSASGTSMPQHHGRRGPRTIPAVGISSATCWNDQLTRGPQIPDLDVGMGDIEGAWLDELRRIASVSPQGQKRILAIVQPMVYRLRVRSFRGATWVDEGSGTVWLSAVHRREHDSDDDAYA